MFMKKRIKPIQCDICGRWVGFTMFNNGGAIRRMVTPDSDRSTEDYETFCMKCVVEHGLGDEGTPAKMSRAGAK